MIGGSTLENIEIILISIIITLGLTLIVWALFSSLVIIQEYEIGVYMKLGRFKKKLGPGVHLVTPFISRVHRADTRIQTIDLGRQEIMSRDLSPTILEAIMQFRLVEPDRCLLKVDKYRSTITNIAQTTLRKISLEYDLEDLIRKQNLINSRFFKSMKEEGEPIGIEFTRTEIKNIDPVGPIKAAMEDRIAAEKERQAIILRADGRKRAMMMVNEARSSR
ncbi:MAG: SPFH domain-containing protein [Candidatus Thermoplasmatota archaeon]|nr:SPFH domain-containing protein [Candidatus Thermoplasmatota archaeon]